jgi:hypothetical protein
MVAKIGNTTKKKPRSAKKTNPKTIKKAVESVSADLLPAVTDISPVPAGQEWKHRGSVARKVREMELKPENIVQRKAFEAYLEMGELRSLPAVAQMIGKNVALVQAWSAKYNWVQRCLAWEAENQGNLTLESFSENRRKKRFMLQLVDAALKDSAILDEDGNVEKSKIMLRSASDIRTFVALRQEILDEGKVKTNLPGSGTQNIQNAVFIIRK